MKSFAFKALRIVLAVIFIWPFFDKLLGLNISTPRANAWIHGGSPTSGFLASAAHGPFAGIFHLLAHHAIIDWIFMLGILGIGLSLLTGIWLRFAAICGAILMILMFLARIPPETNPLFDEHIVYALVLLLIAGAAHKKHDRMVPAMSATPTA